MAKPGLDGHDRGAKVIAAALWSFVHGYITLELGDHFTDFDDPVTQVMLPMGVTFSVGLGDDPERATASHEAALKVSRQALKPAARAARSARASEWRRRLESPSGPIGR